MSAQDFPVTTPYGQVAGYPLHNGFHQGVDYGCPVGTPVVVNGVVIGLSGNTGYTFGPHLHVGKWLGGGVLDPTGAGFSFKSAVVTEINEDADNGKYVRVQGDGFSWVYLHLSDNSLVKAGTKLEGGAEVQLTAGQVDKLIKMSLNREPTAQELSDPNYQNNPGLAIDTFWNNGGEDNYLHPAVPAAQPLPKGIYEVK